MFLEGNVISHWRKAVPKPIDGFNKNLILTADEFKASLPRERPFSMSFDFETSSLNCEEGNVVGFSYSFDGQHAFYVPVRHLVGLNYTGPDPLSIIYNVLTKAHVVYLFNARFDLRFLEKIGYDGSEINYFDCMALVFNMDTNLKTVGLKWATEFYLGYKFPTYQEVVEGVENFAFVDPKVAYDYAGNDAIATFLIAKKLGPILEKECPIIIKVDSALMYPMMKYEDTIIDLDLDHLLRLKDEATQRIQDAERSAWAIAGTTFNIGSGKQVSDVLLSLGIDTGGKTTKTGYLVTANKVLGKVSHPLVKEITRYRETLKLRNSYVEVLIEAAKTRKARFSYLPFHVPTGRLAAGSDAKNSYFTRLNIQAVVKQSSAIWYAHHDSSPGSIFGYRFSREEKSPLQIEGMDEDLNVRAAFFAPPGYLFFHLDFSAEELKIAACLCLSYDELVSTNYGVISLSRVKQLVEKNYDVWVSTPSGMKSVSYFHDNGVQELFEVEFSDGRVVKCTAEHKFLVSSRDNLIFKCLKEIQEGDQIITEEDHVDSTKVRKLLDQESVLFRGV